MSSFLNRLFTRGNLSIFSPRTTSVLPQGIRDLVLKVGGCVLASFLAGFFTNGAVRLIMLFQGVALSVVCLASILYMVTNKLKPTQANHPQNLSSKFPNTFSDQVFVQLINPFLIVAGINLVAAIFVHPLIFVGLSLLAVTSVLIFYLAFRRRFAGMSKSSGSNSATLARSRLMSFAEAQLEEEMIIEEQRRIDADEVACSQSKNTIDASVLGKISAEGRMLYENALERDRENEEELAEFGGFPYGSSSEKAEEDTEEHSLKSVLTTLGFVGIAAFSFLLARVFVPSLYPIPSAMAPFVLVLIGSLASTAAIFNGFVGFRFARPSAVAEVCESEVSPKAVHPEKNHSDVPELIQPKPLWKNLWFVGVVDVIAALISLKIYFALPDTMSIGSGLLGALDGLFFMWTFVALVLAGVIPVSDGPYTAATLNDWSPLSHKNLTQKISRLNWAVLFSKFGLQTTEGWKLLLNRFERLPSDIADEFSPWVKNIVCVLEAAEKVASEGNIRALSQWLRTREDARHQLLGSEKALEQIVNLSVKFPQTADFVSAWMNVAVLDPSSSVLGFGCPPVIVLDAIENRCASLRDLHDLEKSLRARLSSSIASGVLLSISSVDTEEQSEFIHGSQSPSKNASRSDDVGIPPSGGVDRRTVVLLK